MAAGRTAVGQGNVLRAGPGCSGQLLLARLRARSGRCRPGGHRGPIREFVRAPKIRTVHPRLCVTLFYPCHPVPSSVVRLRAPHLAPFCFVVRQQRLTPPQGTNSLPTAARPPARLKRSESLTLHSSLFTLPSSLFTLHS